MITIKKLIFIASLFSLSLAASTVIDDNGEEVPVSDDPATAFFLAVSMIGISEIGDKTFLIAALMAMRHDRLLVFSASAFSLVIMTILAGIVGRTFTSFIPQRYTLFLAGILFLVFGYKLILEGLEMSKDAGVEEELAEVEEEIAVQDINQSLGANEQAMQMEATKYVSNDKLNSIIVNFMDLSTRYVSPTWIQIFIMVFLGEFGDRSQISTIAMASGSDYFYVILGASVGHAICTAIAVIGGKLLASRISMRTVTLGGAFSFFVFGGVYVYESFQA